jgi:hypothetical protein
MVRIVPLLCAAAEVPRHEWTWPERGKNSRCCRRLSSAFVSAVTRLHALGVRCSYCHVGQEGRPLSTFDFVSDQNPNKDRAREMYRMLGDINGHLKKIQPSADKRVNMWCQTCHRGRPRPTTLAEELDAARLGTPGGAPAALARYRELKQRFDETAGSTFEKA